MVQLVEKMISRVQTRSADIPMIQSIIKRAIQLTDQMIMCAETGSQISEFFAEGTQKINRPVDYAAGSPKEGFVERPTYISSQGLRPMSADST